MYFESQHEKSPADHLRVSPPIAQPSQRFGLYIAPFALTDLSLGQSDEGFTSILVPAVYAINSATWAWFIAGAP